ncbi:alkene reductase [Paroceanicella profunda]|uniref:Alkene reductase n=1 Tax=Paroceanicella profunda TaxID=2579971 RepID=A0A5B8FQP2_9RHOB|nr:alkene reductase [Paroceanicella profunda]QDL90705.1 alkene reductase [Paroceanicella profunda]
MAHDALFKPMEIGAITVPNRVLMAPLTRNRAQADGTPNALAGLYYAQRASAGLIISEATQISAQGKGYKDTPGIYTPGHVAAWSEIVNRVHAAGGRIVLQLWHVGRISHTSLQPDGASPVAPSAIRAKGKTYIEEGFADVSEPRALETSELAGIVEDYRHAAKCAKDAGFDGVEIHAANGYLLHQFIADQTNTRTDSYGGSISNRIRLTLEVVRAVNQVWPSDRIGIRLTPTQRANDCLDSTPEATFGALLDALAMQDLAYVHFVEKFPGAQQDETELGILKRLREKVRCRFIGNGDYGTEEAEQRVASGAVDAVAFGRKFIANPDLPERLRTDAELNTPDQATFYGGGSKGYVDYPFLEAETD